MTEDSINRAPKTDIAELIANNPVAAIAELEAAVAHSPHNRAALRLLARAHRASGNEEKAESAEMAAIRAATLDPRLIEIAGALRSGDLPTAEGLLRDYLGHSPTDVAAIRMMAELAARIGRVKDSEKLLRRALEIAPSFTAARANLATILYKQNRYEEAATALNEVLARDPRNLSSRNLLAAAKGRIGDYDEALSIYSDLTAIFPGHAKLWMSYAHILKTVGQQAEAIAAYRRALEVDGALGEVWWSLANLKTVNFTADDIAAMEAALQTTEEHENIFHLHFALGKAYNDEGKAEESFTHYARGNALRSEELGYTSDQTKAQVDRMTSVLDAPLLASIEGAGCPAPDPIFILGLPRAGSTLLEQILSSHSQIEGTMELPDIPAIAMREAKEWGENGRDWPGALAKMPRARIAELGVEFLERTKVQRKTDKPYYIDKLPNNWAYAGFIHAILPNAKIIDARRHPMDCCFSNFRQHFAKGQAFSYSLDHIGRYYADYVRAMDHYAQVLPGRMHLTVHERVLEAPEDEVRAMLAYLGLPFEEACMEFYGNKRAVRTASSEQVRRPINRDGVGQWEPYEAWLDELKQALGDLPETYARSFA